MAANTDPAKVKLRNVRLSFPHLFKPHAMEDGQEPKFSASFLLDPATHAPEIANIKQAVNAVAAKFWNGKIPGGVKVCLRDGNEKSDLDGYEGMMFVPAGNKRPPGVVDQDPRIQLNATDNKPYAGCYVNAVLRLWCQDNKFGKRVNASLELVQFVADGDPFGAPGLDAEAEFEPVDGSSVPPPSAAPKAASTVASLF